MSYGFAFDHFPGTSTRMLEFHMQMPLQGLFGGYNNQGEILRANASLDHAKTTLEKLRAQARLELVKLSSERSAAAQRLHGLKNDVLPVVKQVSATAEKAYGMGAISLTDLLESRRALRNTTIEMLAARAEFAKTESVWQFTVNPESWPTK